MDAVTPEGSFSNTQRTFSMKLKAKSVKEVKALLSHFCEGGWYRTLMLQRPTEGLNPYLRLEQLMQHGDSDE